MAVDFILFIPARMRAFMAGSKGRLSPWQGFSGDAVP